MALITMRQLLDHAAENDYALPAFNVNNLEYVQAVMRAADATDSPVILQASRGARSYAGDAFLRHLILGAAEEYPHIPVCLHLDHGDQPSTCISAITNGFTSVMMDGSLLADGKSIASYEYNVDVTAEVVKIAHAAGVSVEGELGCLGNLETGAGEKEDGHGFEGKLTRDELLTDPDQALDFVSRPASTRSPSPSAPATAPTSSPARRTATSCRSTRSPGSTRSCRTRISSCTARHRFRRTCRISSPPMAAR